MRIILLIMIGLSFLKADFIRDDVNQIVTDSFTGLQWQDDGNVTAGTYTWQNAIDYCENLNLGGHNDWHLPNKNELQTIVDTNKFSPAISSVFAHTSSSAYWSSTTEAGGTSNVWLVVFDDGNDVLVVKGSISFVRCVR